MLENKIIKAARRIFIDEAEYADDVILSYYKLLQSIVSKKDFKLRRKDIYISKIDEVLDTLISEKNKKHLRLYFGLDDGKRRTHYQIAQIDSSYVPEVDRSNVTRTVDLLYDYLHMYSVSRLKKVTNDNSIYLLNLSRRTRRTLERVGLNTIDELLAMTRRELSQVYSLGPVRTEEVWQALNPYKATKQDVLKNVDVLNDSLEVLMLSNRAYNALRRGGIHKISELLKLSDKELFSMSTIGTAVATEIMDKRDEFLAKR